MSGGFRQIGEDMLIAGHVDLVDAKFEAPDGTPFSRRVVRHPGAVGVVAIDGHDVVLVRQYRAPIAAALLEIPAGTLEPGEPPEVTAHHELVEEIGYQAASLVHLSSFLTAPGFCDEVLHVYLADELTEVGTAADGIEEQHMDIVRMPLADVPARVADGTLRDAKTIIGLLLARDRL